MSIKVCKIQYSVFLCQLNAVERERLKGTLTNAINTREDQIIIVSLGRAESDIDYQLTFIGQAYSSHTRVIVV